ncbi:MAG TPA: hypothetical protein PK293_16250 [Spirochaetota bacterium]|nr:hypothetical protein [Spirochaetota bacterium]
MYAIQKYVLEKMKEKHLRKGEFVKRLGYSNISKGCRRFDSFLAGEAYPENIISNLHAALDVDKNEINELLRETEIEFQKEMEVERLKRDEEGRKNFVPYLYCHTERRIPSPIFVCAILGADRLKIRKLPADFCTLSYEKQNDVRKKAIKEIIEKFDGTIPSFGRIKYFTQRLEYDDPENERKVYNIKGELITDPPDDSKKIYQGKATLTCKGQDITGFFRKWREKNEV